MINKKKILGLAAGAGLALAMSSASASAITLNLVSGQSAGLYSSIDYGPVVVTAGSFCCGGTYQVEVDTTPLPGLGVNDGRNGDPDEIDGIFDEFLEFNFDYGVKITHIRLIDGDHDTNFASNNDWDAWAGATQLINEQDIEDVDSNGWIDLSALDFTGTNFRFGADGSNDRFYIQKIKYDVLSKEVPEPAALGLIGLGLLGMGVAIRRRKAA